MPRWAAIGYRDFWDVPRIFFLRDAAGRLLLFDCQFDHIAKNHPDDYVVYRMPELAPHDFAGSWAGLHRRAVARLGVVPVARVRFDEQSRPTHVDAAFFDALAAPAG